MIKTPIGITIQVNTNFDEAIARVTDALQVEGFGVLTTIDVKETLKKKLGVDFRPYRILGACNPPLAHRALIAAPEAGLLLPCNVTVSQNMEGIVEISFVDPLAMLAVVVNSALQPIAQEAQARLERVAEALEEKSHAFV